MKKFILGTKIGMTQIFEEDGSCIPVTVVKAGPCVVLQKKTVETDGYDSVRVGYEEVDAKKLNKPDNGLFNKTGINPMRYIKEFRTEEINSYDVGTVIKAEDMFEVGNRVDVSGVSKGKGFQGVIKRHGQKISKMTHGSRYHRRIGSMGQSATPGRVFKGKKMPGQMGAEKVTVQNLDIVRVDAERGLLLIKGAVPGPKGGIVTVKQTHKVK